MPKKTSKNGSGALARLESEWTKLQKRFEKEITGWQKRAKKSEAYKKVQKLRKDLDKQVGEVRSQVLHGIGLATKDDVDRVARRVRSLDKKVTDLAA